MFDLTTIQLMNEIQYRKYLNSVSKGGGRVTMSDLEDVAKDELNFGNVAEAVESLEEMSKYDQEPY